MSEYSSGAVPVSARASVLRPATERRREFPLPWPHPRRCTIFVVAGSPARHGLPDQVCACHLISMALLLDHSLGGGDLAIDRPDEGRELAGNRGDGDGLELSPPGQSPKPRVQTMLRLPGDLANGSRRRCHFGLLLLADPRRMPIAPGALDQNPARPAVPGLGDGAALDRIAGRMLGP